MKNTSGTLPISVYGDGTRSWISILTLSTYIESIRNQLTLEGLPYFAIVLLEEPESHLHPQAQNKVISQLDKINAQIFVTTHSSSIVSELGVFQLYRVCNDGNTKLQTKHSEIKENDKLKIINFILPFYTEILFSDFVILVEGVTEKILFTEYIKFKLKKSPFELGISIIAVNGKDNFSIFRQFCEIHSIRNIIYADQDATVSLTSAIDDKNLEKDNIIYTSNIDIEQELVTEQFEVCKDLFFKEKKLCKQHIDILQSSGALNDKVVTFLKNNKSQYPHWLFRSVKNNFSIKSFDSVISKIRRG